MVYCIHSMDTRLLAAIGEAVLDVYCSKGTFGGHDFGVTEILTLWAFALQELRPTYRP